MKFMYKNGIKSFSFKGQTVFPCTDVSKFIGRSESYANSKTNDGFLKEGKDFIKLSDKDTSEIMECNVGYSGNLKTVITLNGFKRLYDNCRKIDKGFPYQMDEAQTKRPSINKKKYAEFVWLTDEEYAKLKSEFNVLTEKMIEKLNYYKGSSGKKYNSDYLAIRSWVVDKVLSEQQEVKPVIQKENRLNKMAETLTKTARKVLVLSDNQEMLITKLEIIENELAYYKEMVEQITKPEKEKKQTFIGKMKNLLQKKY